VIRRLRVAAEGRGGHVLPHIRVVRHDGIVHVVKYTEGASEIALDGRGTPVDSSFRMHMRCDQAAKMYLGGRNRITSMHPTCVRCIGGSS
jgi:hypothetical protein